VKTVTTIAEVRRWRHEGEGDVGLVPTMGALHEGHLSLVRRARAENGRVAASIFVNPRQFGASEDLARYPRDLEGDWRLLKETGCDLLFAPPVEAMYPLGSETFVEVGSVSAPLEGQSRPGHFRGVATIVLKLLGVCEPRRAYFGQKDAQQLAVIRRMVADLNVPVEIVGCPIVREPDGLAMSSRNRYLSDEQRRAAPVIHRALTTVRDRVATGVRDGEELRRALRQVLTSEPLVQIDYVSVADPESLRELATVSDKALVSVAVRLGTTRLIDNVLLGE
jgi:pantoate--beta-alanine ligase